MAEKTKQELIDTFVDGYLMRGSDFADMLESLKGRQSPVSSPSSSGSATAFIDTIRQDAEGKIVATKKNVNFGGYQTVAGMVDYQTVTGMSTYQSFDLQQTGSVTVGAGESQTITHNMKHYPTVRLMDAYGVEVRPSDYKVMHIDGEKLEITLDGSLVGSYKYVLD